MVNIFRNTGILHKNECLRWASICLSSRLINIRWTARGNTWNTRWTMLWRILTRTRRSNETKPWYARASVIRLRVGIDRWAQSVVFAHVSRTAIYEMQKIQALIHVWLCSRVRHQQLISIMNVFDTHRSTHVINTRLNLLFKSSAVPSQVHLRVKDPEVK